jgi:hypothetical protein
MGKNKKFRLLRKECRDVVSRNESVLNPDNQLDIKKTARVVYRKAKKDLINNKGR